LVSFLTSCSLTGFLEPITTPFFKESSALCRLTLASFKPWMSNIHQLINDPSCVKHQSLGRVPFASSIPLHGSGITYSRQLNSRPRPIGDASSPVSSLMGNWALSESFSCVIDSIFPSAFIKRVLISVANDEVTNTNVCPGDQLDKDSK